MATKRCGHERCPKCRARFDSAVSVCRDHGLPLDECRRHIYGHLLFARRCADCGHYLSLGPANMTDEARVELRAAELGNGWTKERGAIDGTTLDEDIGFLIPDEPTGAEQLAGYLARAIATHDDGGGE